MINLEVQFPLMRAFGLKHHKYHPAKWTVPVPNIFVMIFEDLLKVSFSKHLVSYVLMVW